jgi:hypothetical protein
MTVTMYIDRQLVVNGRNVVKNDKKKLIKKMNARGRSSSHISLYNLFQCRRLRIAAPEIESKI